MEDTDGRGRNDLTSPPPPVPEGPLPSERGMRILAFAFLALVEYWLAPLLFGITNGAGLWSVVGQLLFIGWLAALTLVLFRPLAVRLRPILADRSHRLVFSSVALGGFVAGLAATRTFVRSTAAGGGMLGVGSATVYTPFGAWPALTVTIPPLGISGAITPVIVAVLGTLSILSASLVVLARARAAAECRAGANPAWRGSAASVLIWTPLGLLSGCSACTPLYLGLVGVLFPSAAATGYSFLPFAPWGAFAGLVYVGAVAGALFALRHVTRPLVTSEPEPSSSEVPP